MNPQDSNRPEPLDPAQCAVCGQPNRCAMEVEKTTGQKQASCWCTAVSFEPSVLAQIPASRQGLACICKDCATQRADRRARQK
jgi:Cysteine-rich CWC